MSAQQTAPAQDADATRQRPGATTVKGATGAGDPNAPRGKTSVADVVVVKIVGMAAREIPGVYDMGGGHSRTLGTLRNRVRAGAPTWDGA